MMSRGVDLGLTGRQPRSVQSALAVLQHVARAGAGVTAKEVAEQVGLPPATTYRLLNLLVAEEYLVRLPDLHGFALGCKVGELWNASGQARVPAAARDVMAELRATTRFGVHLITYGPTSLHCSDVDPDHPLRSVGMVERYPHATAVGRLLLAEQLSWRELVPRARLRKITPLTTATYGELEEKIGAVTGSSFVTQVGELHSDVSCLAVPVRARTGELVAALATSASGGALALHTTVDPLLQHAHRLSPLLG